MNMRIARSCTGSPFAATEAAFRVSLDVKANKDDEEYTKNLQQLAERAFSGCPQNKVANWVTVEFRHGVRPLTVVEKPRDIRTTLLRQLVNLEIKKRQELQATLIYQKPQKWQKSTPSPRVSLRYALDQGSLPLLVPRRIIYLDDSLVFGGDIREHNANLELALDRLRDAGLTLNPKKCHFLQRSVTLVEHAVSSDGIAVTEDRVQQQAKKNFKWEKEHNEAFKEQKRMLCSTPILALPNFESSAPPFKLDTADTSDAAVGGVLSQRGKKGREHGIAYESTRLAVSKDLNPQPPHLYNLCPPTPQGKKKITKLCKTCQITKTCVTPEHLEGNSQVEGTNRLLRLLKVFPTDAQLDDWDLSLGRVILTYKATVHKATGVPPFKMLTAREMRVPSGIFLPNTDEAASNVPERNITKNSRPKVYREDLEQIYRLVPPPGIHHNFHYPWSKDPFQVVETLSPTNYYVHNAQLRTYKGPPPVGHEDENYTLTEDRKLPNGNFERSS
ncbi:Retrovirus-related Pol polyprotein [Echinococcus granulosus]|uniref:Retrovirus-related Pol polyprotein n=1 Tax=Echinococcus granulosus TaxID=6210 RepID=W6V3M7_ECHGR|nr:Retrovirus-related Pol polyprotein [Echinococcus granulosus]EUB60634.1 Retrovirus-related Pol polyprotein [Echinococcus granulosus]